MKKTQLILLEGITGSGKSTMAHVIVRHLIAHNIPYRWWYEEVKEHPLYIFHDAPSMQAVLDSLKEGNYVEVVHAALEKWRSFVEMVQASYAVVVIDGCLFGYLTWTLFHFGVPEEVIHDYLYDVEQIIEPLFPCLIYLYQKDVAGALQRTYTRRGTNVEERIQGVTRSIYGQQHGLQGFDGLVTYWTRCRDIMNTAFAHVDFAKLSIENSAGEWSIYERQVLDFLEIAPIAEMQISLERLEGFVGTYQRQNCEDAQSCTVQRENGHLYVDGLSLIWPRNKLIPLSPTTFAVESFPIEICFKEQEPGIIHTMRVKGAEMLFEESDATYVKVEE